MKGLQKRPAGALIAAVIAVSGCSREPQPPATFNKDVAPIVFANCVTCHRPGGDGPFSLLTYADAARHARDIGEETLARHMPPWLPEPGGVAIVGVRRLSQIQIDTIQRWIREGTQEGAPSDLPTVPSFRSEWQLGTPDAVLTMPRPFVLGPGREDVYRNVILQGTVPNGAFIRAVELRTNGSPIHHAIVRLARGPVPRARDGDDGQPGFNGMSSETLQDPEGQLLGWAPGRGPMVSPDGMPWSLEAGAALALELHLIPSDRPQNVQPSVAVYFSSAPPVRRAVNSVLAMKQIDIPAGRANYVVTDNYRLPVAAELIGLFPHAHLLGKEILITATPPAGSPQTLLHIKHWSFHWQQDYQFVKPVSLPQGTVIDLRFSYDNSAGNPENPSNPPVRVRVGSRSRDEMANVGFLWLTSSPEDTTALLASFREKHVLGNIAYGEARVRETPASLPDRLLLGSSYAQAGRYADALPQLEAALAMDPRNAITESQLGGAYLALGRLQEAVPHFERSARLAPRDERAQINLADALRQSGKLAAAEAAYRRAVAINGDSLEAHAKLADLLAAAGRLKDALPHLRRLVELRPNSADPHSDLGGALLVLGQRDEAAQHIRRALDLDPNHAGAKQNLALLNRGR
ncbi:MAG TPA: tetratricopeptide repeat protein [Vicinamibacterales bacterium]|nr:tetratricopeptide repeat protein [Vicinamibacterales bacterium]